ncbi:MAG: hypothetical protein AABX86_01570, partial [Nanoarchaeota archaeon]
MSCVQRILYVPKLGLGDLIFSIPLIRSLQAAYPQAGIFIPINDDSTKKELLKKLNCKSVADENKSYPAEQRFIAKEHWTSLQESRSLLSHDRFYRREKRVLERYLQGLSYDYILLTSPITLQGVHGEQLSVRDIRTTFPQSEDMHIADQLLCFAQLLGIPLKKEYNIDVEELRHIQLYHAERLKYDKPYIVLHVGPSIESKLWDPENLKKVA